MEIEELVAILVGWLGRAAVQHMLSQLVAGARRDVTVCEKLSPGRFDADELGIYDDDEEYRCHD